ncbi:hypothetical protein ACTXT7_014089, partial [Hymenolepis weldensis]
MCTDSLNPIFEEYFQYPGLFTKLIHVPKNPTEKCVTNQNEVSVSNQLLFKPISSPLIFENRPTT